MEMEWVEDSVKSLGVEGKGSDSDVKDEGGVLEDAKSGEGGSGVASSREKQEGKIKSCYRKEKLKSRHEDGMLQSSGSEASFRRLPRISRRSKPMEDVQWADEELEQPKEQSSGSNLTRSGIQKHPSPGQKRESKEETDNRFAYGLEEL